MENKATKIKEALKTILSTEPNDNYFIQQCKKTCDSFINESQKLLDKHKIEALKYQSKKKNKKMTQHFYDIPIHLLIKMGIYHRTRKKFQTRRFRSKSKRLK